MKLRAFHKLSYGVYIVASEFEGQKDGYIANTVFQVASNPALLAISCHKNNLSTEIIRNAGAFSVSALKKDLDVRIIGDFGFMSGKDIDKFKGRETIKAKTGVPVVLSDSVAWFDCKVKEMVDLGSHWLIVGEVLDSDLISEEEPLTYAIYREKYKMLSPKNSPTFIERDKLAEEEQQDLSKTTEAEDGKKKRANPYVCIICGFTYNPEEGDPSMGIQPGTPFEDLPEDYRCPICNASKEYFREI